MLAQFENNSEVHREEAQPTAAESVVDGALLIYGAYGQTGSFVAKVAVSRDHEVVLAGNDRERIERLSAELGVRGAHTGLDSQGALRQLIRGSACVIHATGPFLKTFGPMLEACSAEGVPYVDLNGELDVFRCMQKFVEEHRPRIEAARPFLFYSLAQLEM